MADIFCKIDSLAARRLDCKETKTVADKTERITELSRTSRVQSSRWEQGEVDGLHIYC